MGVIGITRQSDNYNEFKYLEEKLSLVINTYEKCPGCKGKMIYYSSLYDPMVDMRLCEKCGELEYGKIRILLTEKNTCPYCNELVKHIWYDEFYEENEKCMHPECEIRAHEECIKKYYMIKSNWFCEKHLVEND